jgi:LysM repeat protein
MVGKKPAHRIGLTWLAARRQWQRAAILPLLARSPFHLGVLALIALALWWSSGNRPSPLWSIRVTPPTATPAAPLRVVSSGPMIARKAKHQEAMRPDPTLPPAATWVQGLIRSPVPHTVIPNRPRKSVITYTVESGDNIFVIAERWGLRPDTLIWSNEELEANPDMLYVGQVLAILPVDGVYHTVAEGETLETIAQEYDVQVSAITGCEWNGLDLDASAIAPGQKLIVPGGVKPFEPRTIHAATYPIPEDAPRGTGDFVWPVGGYVSQSHWDLHRAVDVAGPHGDVVVAADAGFVTYAAWDHAGYGYLVMIDHGNGFVSYYAHLYGFYVSAGESVQRGQPIGARGSTGRSTGPHLHFEIRYDGEPRNPLAFLPGQ